MDLPVRYDELLPYEKRLVRNQYAEIQKGKCFYCGSDLSGPPSDEVAKKRVNRNLFPRTFFSYPIHLHHSHEDGMTIGAVHNYCNAVLWQYEGE